jgi:AcrR family transcriptional regulator
VTDTLQRPAAIDRSVPAILEAAEIVIDRFGHDKLSLGQIARVSLIPLARIYQYFADKNAVLGALSSRALTRVCGSVDPRGAWDTSLSEPQRLARVVDRFAGFVAEPSAAYLVLCGPFDPASDETRQDAVARLASALGHALKPWAETTPYCTDAPDPSAEPTGYRTDALDPSAEPTGYRTDEALVPSAKQTPFRTVEALEYAAELVFACLRRSYLVDGRVTSTAVEMAQHAVASFVTP